MPSNTGFADPDNHGWVDIPNDPFWAQHPDGFPGTPHDPSCRDFVHPGLNIRSSDGRLTGGFLPVGTPAQPGMTIKKTVPCGGSIMRVRMDAQGADGMYAHDKMEVYAFGLRNQSGVAFGPAGTKWANALAVSDNGANDLGNRRIANAPEKLFIFTEMGQDAGFPDKEGFLFVDSKRYGWTHYRGNPVERPHPNLYIGDVRRSFRRRSPTGSRTMSPACVACRGSWPTRIPTATSTRCWNGIPTTRSTASPGVRGGFGTDNNLFGAVYGILDTGPESVSPTWPAVLRVEFLEPTGVRWSYFARNIEMGPNAYQKPENRGGLERPNDVAFSNDGKTMYVVDYGEVFTDFTLPAPFYTVAGSGVVWTITKQ